MCDRSNTLELCSCTDMSVQRIQELYIEEIKNLKRKELLKVVRWKLKKYIGHEWIGMDGLLISPSESITEALSQDFVLSQLNSKHCFDFDYEPKEGDNLILEIGWMFNKWKKSITKGIGHDYASFIFKNGKWIADYYNAFYEKTELITEGVLKNNPKDTSNK